MIFAISFNFTRSKVSPYFGHTFISSLVLTHDVYKYICYNINFRLQEYSFVVTAKDGAPEPRLGTATVTVQVQDIPDEVPFFKKTSYRISIPENVPDLLVTQVTVRFFSF